MIPSKGAFGIHGGAESGPGNFRNPPFAILDGPGPQFESSILVAWFNGRNPQPSGGSVAQKCSNQRFPEGFPGAPVAERCQATTDEAAFGIPVAPENPQFEPSFLPRPFNPAKMDTLGAGPRVLGSRLATERPTECFWDSRGSQKYLSQGFCGFRDPAGGLSGIPKTLLAGQKPKPH